MSWLEKLDGLTKKSSVTLSRRSFFKKLGFGAATVVAIGVINPNSALAGPPSSSCFNGGSWVLTPGAPLCSSTYVGCESCGSGKLRSKTIVVRNYTCNTNGEIRCGTNETVYGTCGSCALRPSDVGDHSSKNAQ